MDCAQATAAYNSKVETYQNAMTVVTAKQVQLAEAEAVAAQAFMEMQAALQAKIQACGGGQ